MKHAPKQIHARAPHRLLLEEIVRREADPVLQALRRDAPVDGARQVLDHAVEIREAGGEGNGGEAAGAAAVDDGEGTEGGPRLGGEEGRDVWGSWSELAGDSFFQGRFAVRDRCY